MENTNWEYIEARVSEGIHKSQPFDKWLANAPDQEAIESDLKLYYALRKNGLEHQLKKISITETSFQDNPSPEPVFKVVKAPMSWKWGIAAGIALVAGFAWYLFDINELDKEMSNNTPKTEETVIDTNPLQGNDLLQIAYSNAIPDNSSFQKIINLINQEDYTKANQLVLAYGKSESDSGTEKPKDQSGDNFFGASPDSNQPKDKPQSKPLTLQEKDYLSLYSGIIELKKENFDKAEIYFSAISDTKTSKEAKWYLALVNLGKNDLERAEALLKDVTEDSENPFYEQAETLLLNF